MSEFLKTDIGLGMFPLPYKGNRSKIRILRRPCKDPKGCICGNDKPEVTTIFLTLKRVFFFFFLITGGFVLEYLQALKYKNIHSGEN